MFHIWPPDVSTGSPPLPMGPFYLLPAIPMLCLHYMSLSFVSLSPLPHPPFSLSLSFSLSLFLSLSLSASFCLSASHSLAVPLYRYHVRVQFLALMYIKHIHAIMRQSDVYLKHMCVGTCLHIYANIYIYIVGAQVFNHIKTGTGFLTPVFSSWAEGGRRACRSSSIADICRRRSPIVVVVVVARRRRHGRRRPSPIFVLVDRRSSPSSTSASSSPIVAGRGGPAPGAEAAQAFAQGSAEAPQGPAIGRSAATTAARPGARSPSAPGRPRPPPPGPALRPRRTRDETPILGKVSGPLGGRHGAKITTSKVWVSLSLSLGGSKIPEDQKPPKWRFDLRSGGFFFPSGGVFFFPPEWRFDLQDGAC